jgi:hypothetical protein
MSPIPTSVIRFGIPLAAVRVSALLLLVWLEQTGRQTISALPLVFLLYPEGLLMPYRADAGIALRVIVLSALLVVGSLAAVALVYLLAKRLSR